VSVPEIIRGASDFGQVGLRGLEYSSSCGQGLTLRAEGHTGIVAQCIEEVSVRVLISAPRKLHRNT